MSLRIGSDLIQFLIAFNRSSYHGGCRACCPIAPLLPGGRDGIDDRPLAIVRDHETDPRPPSDRSDRVARVARISIGQKLT